MKAARATAYIVHYVPSPSRTREIHSSPFTLPFPFSLSGIVSHSSRLTFLCFSFVHFHRDSLDTPPPSHTQAQSVSVRNSFYYTVMTMTNIFPKYVMVTRNAGHLRISLDYLSGRRAERDLFFCSVVVYLVYYYFRYPLEIE